MTARVRVVGMGNLLHGDDGAGVLAARYLAAGYAFDPDVEIVDGAVLGFDVLGVFDGGAPVLLLDALLGDVWPGAVFEIPGHALLDLVPQLRLAAHEVEPVERLRWHAALGTAPPTVLVGISTGPPRYGIGLSPLVREGFALLVDVALGQLRAWGVRCRPTGTVTLDDVLAGLTTGPRPEYVG